MADPTGLRLARIEAALSLIAARQAVGPPPEGYAPPASGPMAPLSLAVQAAQAAGYLPGGEQQKKRRWLDWPVIRELRLLSRMYFDRRYSPTRAAQIGVPFLIGLAALNYLFWRGWLDWTLVSPVCERLTLAVISVVVYRILAAEMSRYAAVLDYLERSGR
jgi:hypothetical protein